MWIRCESVPIIKSVLCRQFDRSNQLLNMKGTQSHCTMCFKNCGMCSKFVIVKSQESLPGRVKRIFVSVNESVLLGFPILNVIFEYDKSTGNSRNKIKGLCCHCGCISVVPLKCQMRSKVFLFEVKHAYFSELPWYGKLEVIVS